MKKFVIPLVVFVALGVLLWFGLSLDPRKIPSPLIGQSLPDFSLPALHEPARSITPKSLTGRVYLLNVWASWCVECRAEHPALLALAAQKAVTIVGLNYKDQRDDALKWLNDLGNPYELSISDTNGRVGIDIGVYGVPETFVIDKSGVIRYKHIGAITEQAWNEKLFPLIQQLSSVN